MTSEPIAGEDWYGDDLGAVRHVGVSFVDVDLSEVTTSGAVLRGTRLDLAGAVVVAEQTGAVVDVDVPGR